MSYVVTTLLVVVVVVVVVTILFISYFIYTSITARICPNFNDNASKKHQNCEWKMAYCGVSAHFGKTRPVLLNLQESVEALYHNG